MLALIRSISGTDVPVEVFVHGALCVAYSGQCLTSEALGGRSANRGQCAQACRMTYEMIVDGHVHIGKSTRLQINVDGAMLVKVAGSLGIDKPDRPHSLLPSSSQQSPATSRVVRA